MRHFECCIMQCCKVYLLLHNATKYRVVFPARTTQPDHCIKREAVPVRGKKGKEAVAVPPVGAIFANNRYRIERLSGVSESLETDTNAHEVTMGSRK